MTPPIELVPDFIKMCDIKMDEIRSEMESILIKHRLLEEKLICFANYRSSLEKPENEKIALFDGFGYNPDASLSERVRFILRENEKPMTTGQVVARMMELEPGKNDRRHYMTRVSAYLADAVKTGKLKRQSEGGSEFFYWIPEEPTLGSFFNQPTVSEEILPW